MQLNKLFKAPLILFLSFASIQLTSCSRELPFQKFESQQIIDPDQDGVASHLDNCPLTYNPEQIDILPASEDGRDPDGNGVGDKCEMNSNLADYPKPSPNIISVTANPDKECVLDFVVNDPSEAEVSFVINAEFKYHWTVHSYSNAPSQHYEEDRSTITLIDSQGSGEKNVSFTYIYDIRNPDPNSSGFQFDETWIRLSNPHIKDIRFKAILNYPDGSSKESEVFEVQDPCTY